MRSRLSKKCFTLTDGILIPSILVIGDDKAKRETLAMYLRAEGLKVYTAEDKKSGLDVANTKHPDLTIINKCSPKGMGSNIHIFMQRLQMCQLSCRTWGILIKIVIGLNTGGDYHVIVPVWFSRVFTRIHDTKRQIGSPSLMTELFAGDLRLDLVARKSFKSDKEIQLSPREFILLAAFMHNIGAVLSREFLFARVWCDDCQGNFRTVDVHVRWLRGKVEEDPSKSTVHLMPCWPPLGSI